MAMRPDSGWRRACILSLALLLSDGACADTLVQQGPEAFLLGEIVLTSPHAYRAVVSTLQIPTAFRFDGNSNWLEAEKEVAVEPGNGLSAGAWLALAAPPGDTAALIYLAEGGFFLGLNRWRQPEVRLGGLRASGSDPLPVGEWVHLAADWDGTWLRLRVNGRTVASGTGQVPRRIAGPFAVGRALDAGFQQDVHPLGAINGVLAEVTFRRKADPVSPGPAPESPPDLRAPDIWFHDDPDRPRLAPMGNAGWTNEPHSLTRLDGLWHLYYQANPNGAYWRNIVWGHQVSDDLATWHDRPPALMPGTGFDRRGAWVGNWIPDRKPPAVAYTGVNGEWSGIGLAEARPDGSLRQTGVIRPKTPIAFHDMRDPWVLRTRDSWLMLIGAGSLARDEAFIFSYRSQDGTHFEPSGRFDTGGVQVPGEYWELPMLFEMDGRWVLMATPVVPGVAARTLYWTGAFDGTRFVPDDVRPRQFDILATYRAPTIHADGKSDPVAIGIAADEIRDEAERHASGWVHVLTPATRLAFCADDPNEICQTFVPALEDMFSTVRGEAPNPPPQAFDSTDPVLLEAQVSAPQGAQVRIGLRRDGQGQDAASLTIDAASGEVRLEVTVWPLLPQGRSVIITGHIPPSDRLHIRLMLDRALVFGTINGRPLAFLAFAGQAGRDRFAFDLVGEGAVLDRFKVLAHP